MPAYNRVVLAGTLGGNLEEFSVSCAFWSAANPPVDTASALSVWATSIAADLTANGLGVALEAAMGVSVGLREVACYFYPDIGTTASAVGREVTLVDGDGSSIHPYSTAIVASLATDRAGRSGRGRMYWPALAVTITSGGAIGSATAQAVADDVAALLRRIGDEAGVGVELDPAVVSEAAAVVTPVTSVRVGTVPDSQRRRRRSLVELYRSAPIPA